LAAAIFLASGVLTLILPNRAVGEEELVSAGGEVEAKAS
jgi:hypothetical protein